MNKKGLNTNLLEGGDFKSLSQDVEVNIKDIDYNKEQVESIAENIKYEEKIKDRDLAIFKTSMKKLDNIISSTEMLLDQLSNVSYTQKEQNITKKLQAAFEAKRDEYTGQKRELELLVKDKKLERRIQNIPEVSLQGSMMSSMDADEQMQSDLPVLQVYDQEKFVNQRTDKVKQIKNDARDLNNLAVQINTKVVEQDGMLDSLNKDLENNKKIVQEANKDLFIAAQKGEESRKSQWMCLLLLFVIVAGVVIFVLFQAGVFDKKDQ